MATPEAESTGRIILSRRLRRPIRVRISDKDSSHTHEYLTHTPVRVGYGKDCEIHLEGSEGPHTLFEFSPVQGPTKLSTPVRLQDVQDHVEISVDGKPYQGAVEELKPGAHVRIRDRASDRRFDLLVDEPPFWARQLRVLLLTLLVLVGISAIYGLYLYRSIGETEQRLTQAETRLSDAEQSAQLIDARIEQILTQVDSRELAVEKALSELQSMQSQSQDALRTEFSDRLNQIRTESSQALAQTAQEDIQGRERLAADTTRRVAALRQEVSEKLVGAFERFKGLEKQVFERHAQRLQSLEIQGDRLKQVLARSISTVLFVRTRYTARIAVTNEEKVFESAGTAFLVNETGVAIAPQHVFEPWRFDEEFLALRELGVVELVPESLTRHVWTAGQQVIDAGSHPPQYLTDNAFADRARERALLVLHRPEPTTTTKLVPTPLGIAEVQSPIPGPTDVIVFQLLDFSQRYANLLLEAESTELNPLDEVLVVGYPMGRLDDGRSTPQGVKGFVRRIGKELLELDTALHPGISGAPVLNHDGSVVGMAIAMIGSVSYGAAVPATHLRAALQEARALVQANEKRMHQAGCQPGPVDGLLDARTWQAMQAPGCEWR